MEPEATFVSQEHILIHICHNSDVGTYAGLPTNGEISLNLPVCGHFTPAHPIARRF